MNVAVTTIEDITGTMKPFTLMSIDALLAKKKGSKC